MTSIENAVLNNLANQQKHVALTDCFYSWDDEVDMEVMFGGIADRLKAMGKEVKIISFKRNVLDEVEILLDNVVAFKVHRFDTPLTTFTQLSDFMTSDEGMYYYLFCKEYRKLFSNAELKKLSIWAIENLYH